MISKVVTTVFNRENMDTPPHCYCSVSMKINSMDDLDETNVLASKLEKITGSLNTGSGYGSGRRDQNFEVSRKKLPFFLETLKSMFPGSKYKFDSKFRT